MCVCDCESGGTPLRRDDVHRRSVPSQNETFQGKKKAPEGALVSTGISGQRPRYLLRTGKPSERLRACARPR